MWAGDEGGTTCTTLRTASAAGIRIRARTGAHTRPRHARPAPPAHLLPLLPCSRHAGALCRARESAGKGSGKGRGLLGWGAPQRALLLTPTRTRTHTRTRARARTHTRTRARARTRIPGAVTRSLTRRSTLSFCWSPEREDDLVYFAMCYPYTYTDQCRHLDAIEAHPQRARHVRREVLAQTLAGNACEMLWVSDFSAAQSEVDARRVVAISARVHPGESNASLMMHGILDFLTGRLRVRIRVRVSRP